MKRDFTYIDDIVTGVINVMGKVPKETEDGAPYKVYNIGNNKPENLLYFVETLEMCLMREGIIDRPPRRNLCLCSRGTYIRHMPMWTIPSRDFGFKPDTSLEEGPQGLKNGIGSFILIKTETNMRIQKDNILIRTATVDDAVQLNKWWNDGRVMEHAGFPYGLGGVFRRYYRKY